MSHTDDRSTNDETQNEHTEFIHEFDELAAQWDDLARSEQDQAASIAGPDAAYTQRRLAEIRDRLNRYVIKKEKHFQDYKEILQPEQLRIWLAELREIREIQVALRQIMDSR